MKNISGLKKILVAYFLLFFIEGACTNTSIKDRILNWFHDIKPTRHVSLLLNDKELPEEYVIDEYLLGRFSTGIMTNDIFLGVGALLLANLVKEKISPESSNFIPLVREKLKEGWLSYIPITQDKIDLNWPEDFSGGWLSFEFDVPITEKTALQRFFSDDMKPFVNACYTTDLKTAIAAEIQKRNSDDEDKKNK